MNHYKAPWGKSLIVISSSATTLLMGIPLVIVLRAPGNILWIGLGPLVILLCCVPFAIRGYSVTPDAILVHRPFWTTRLPLSGLQSARLEPEAMRRGIRTFGNGGLFPFTGSFRNDALGSYRAFVTDQHHTVVLRYSGRTVVVSPSSPEEFVRDVSALSRAA